MKEYRDLAENAFQLLRDYYTYDEIRSIPLKELFSLIDYYLPKFKEMAKRREQERIKMEMESRRRTARDSAGHRPTRSGSGPGYIGPRRGPSRR